MAKKGRPKEYDDRVTKAVRIDPDLDAKLKRAASERGVSVNLLINFALADYLERLVPIAELVRTSSLPTPSA